MEIDINYDAVVEFTNKLEKLHRSALPVAIRGTLNKAAFDVKQNTMPASAKASFIQREPNFFRANSRVEMAKGFDVTAMKAVVGFTPSGIRGGGNNNAVQELEQQEVGGEIEGRSFVPTKEARGGNKTKSVRPENRLSKINKIIFSDKVPGKNKKVQGIRAALIAGKGGYVVHKGFLFRIDDIQRNGRNRTIKRTPLYTYRKGRAVKINKPTAFMQKASIITANKMDEFYIAEATKQIERLMK